MDYNRYRGNSGRVERASDPAAPPAPTRSPSPLPPPAPPEGTGQGGAKIPPGPLHDLRGRLDGILSRLDPKRLETQDLLVLAILWLLYKDSGDKELLIALGAYLFL